MCSSVSSVAILVRASLRSVFCRIVLQSMSDVDEYVARRLRRPPLKKTSQPPAAGGCDSSGFARVDASPQALPGSSAEGAGSSTDVAGSCTDVAPVALVGETRFDRKKSRDNLRATARRNQQRPPASFNPAGYLELPDICNRVATEWHQQPGQCKCATEWPQFLAVAYASGQAKRVQSVECYDGVLTMEPGQKPVASYRRPGGHNFRERWWYNAVLEGFVVVQTRTGQSRSIAIVN